MLFSSAVLSGTRVVWKDLCRCSHLLCKSLVLELDSIKRPLVMCVAVAVLARRFCSPAYSSAISTGIFLDGTHMVMFFFSVSKQEKVICPRLCLYGVRFVGQSDAMKLLN